MRTTVGGWFHRLSSLAAIILPMVPPNTPVWYVLMAVAAGAGGAGFVGNGVTKLQEKL